MKQLLSPALVKQTLAAHSWIGLLVGALMYIVCLTGTLAVFYEEFERWEQPHIEEYLEYDPVLLEKTFNEALKSIPNITPHMYLMLPKPSVPRVVISTEEEGWFVNADGSLGEKVAHEWTHMLLHLHLYLHLPETFGMVVVSGLGAMLIALIISGLLAHPRIFKDTFAFRLKGSRQLEQTDIHNRLSVWGLPFHLMIAVTGAYFGLVGFIVFVVATAFYDGDREAVIGSVFGEEPSLQQEIGSLKISKAIADMKTIAPESTPLFLVLHEVGTPQQHMELYAKHPGRLIYSENYLFDANGNYLGKKGFSDGEVGKQLVYSVYRLHFGHFGGFPVKIAYGILGLALTVISVTGVNIWLARRKTRDYLTDLWAGIVWGVPPALTLAAITLVLFHIPSMWVFWSAVGLAVLLSLYCKNEKKSVPVLQATCALSLALLITGYCIKFGSAAFHSAAIDVNGVLLIIAMLMGYPVFRKSTNSIRARLADERT